MFFYNNKFDCFRMSFHSLQTSSASPFSCRSSSPVSLIFSWAKSERGKPWTMVHSPLLIVTRKQNKNGLSHNANIIWKCCIFQPVFGCCALQTLVEISLFYVFHIFHKILNWKFWKISQKSIFPKRWLTQKCWYSTLGNWWNQVFRYKKISVTFIFGFYPTLW